MRHREFPITPSQQATTGSLDIFVSGCRSGNLRQMLVGLSVLRSATEAQVHAAIPLVEATQGVSRAEIEAMFAS